MASNIHTSTDLRCEYLRNPLGIDEMIPRLSWVRTSSDRGCRQTAFQILISSTDTSAKDGVGDLWDSGKVLSEHSVNILFSGRMLQSRQACFWRVRWWDQNDRASEWSEIAYFEMGLPKPSDWEGKWISMKEVREFTSAGSTLLGEPLGDYVNALAIYLRAEFTVSKPVARARAYVCGLGWYELRINGAKVGDRVLDPAQTDYRHVGLYSTYDLAPYVSSAKGRSYPLAFAVGIVVGNGRHIRSYGFDSPKAILQLQIDYEDGSADSFSTDTKWKVSYGPLKENGLYYGERLDATAEMAGWDQPGYEDSSWESACVVPGPPLSAQMMEPIRVVETLAPVKWSKLRSGEIVYDFGQNFAGWVRIVVRGSKGTEVRLRHAELLHEDGSLNFSPNQNAEATDVYILCGNGSETYEPRFTYHGFRYLELTGKPEIPSVISVAGCVVHSDVERAGRFSCSHELVNKIHRNILWGQRSNLMSIPTDCSQRDERQGWLGDAHLAAEESMFNFGMAAFYTKFLADIQHAQRPDGSLPDTVPAYLGRLYPADPAWSAAYVTIAWLMYQFYGDTRILERHYESMEKYVTFLRDHSENLLLTKLGKYGDWCPPGSIAPKRTPVELTSTWYFCHDTHLLSRIAGVLGREESQRRLETLASRIRSSFNDAFLKDGEYAVNRFAPVDRSSGQTSNALPLYLDMVPKELKSRVADRLLHSVVNEQDYHLDTGILGTRYLLDVLSDLGYTDVAFRVATQRTYPGWGYMVIEGATTLWERWEKICGGGMNSHNHIMLGSVDAWFYRVLAGISAGSPGWKTIIFKPPRVNGLDSAEAAVRTVLGPASISWNTTDSGCELDVTVPIGASGTVYVPFLPVNQSVLVDGIRKWSGSTAVEDGGGDVVAHGREGQYVVFSIGSGKYRFQST